MTPGCGSLAGVSTGRTPLRRLNGCRAPREPRPAYRKPGAILVKDPNCQRAAPVPFRMCGREAVQSLQGPHLSGPPMLGEASRSAERTAAGRTGMDSHSPTLYNGFRGHFGRSGIPGFFPGLPLWLVGSALRREVFFGPRRKSSNTVRQGGARLQARGKLLAGRQNQGPYSPPTRTARRLGNRSAVPPAAPPPLSPMWVKRPPMGLTHNRARRKHLPP